LKDAGLNDQNAAPVFRRSLKHDRSENINAASQIHRNDLGRCCDLREFVRVLTDAASNIQRYPTFGVLIGFTAMVVAIQQVVNAKCRIGLFQDSVI